jgi:hypothetical protein
MSVTAIEPSLRRAVIELHGIHCLRCGVQCTPDWWSPTSLHIDHVIPEAHGGLTILANLQVLCRTCNLGKGATYADYRRIKPIKTFFGKPTEMELCRQAARSVVGHHAEILVSNKGWRRRFVCECGDFNSEWSGNWAGIKPRRREYERHLKQVA